jgi:predicted nucleic acid-binding Zn ribbon protein
MSPPNFKGQIPKDNGPESIADILGRLFTSRGWGRKNDRLQLEQAWVAAAGADIAAQTKVLGIRRGVLEVEVKGGPLLQELAQYHKRGLLGKLRPALPGLTLTDLKFRAGA